MTLKTILQEAAQFPIQADHQPRVDPSRLKAGHVAFSGSPLQHPDQPERVLLVVDPYSTDPICYEFRAEDVAYVEKLASIIDVDGQTIMMARLWVRKRSIALRYIPFVVDDTASH